MPGGVVRRELVDRFPYVVVFIETEARLLALSKQSDTLKIQYGLTHNEIYHGLLLTKRAAGPGLSKGARLDYWRQASRILDMGIARGNQVNAKDPLTGSNRAMLDAGEAGLAQAHEAIAGR